MTDAIVGVLAQQLYNIIKAEVDVFSEVQSQLDQMIEDLAFMKSFLIDVQHRDKEIVKHSLATIRELIYDADDILLDYQVRTDYWSQTPNMHCTSFHPKQLIFRYQTGNLLKDINKKINQLRTNVSAFGSSITGEKIIPGEHNHSKRWTTSMCDQSETVGLREDTKKIKQWILSQNKDLQRVGIVGMGGLGKTTLAQLIFNDEDVTKSFGEMIWVSVSQRFTATNIMMNMLEQLKEDGRSCVSEAMLLKKIQKALKDKAYLIIMDDVWDTPAGFDWWEQIIRGLPKEEKHNCCIIITTRNEQVAKCMGVAEEWIHWPQVLNPDESWSLFCKIAFKSPKGECNTQGLEKVGKDIMNKCRGLPLAIKTIAGLLSTKPKSTNEWKKINEDFRGKLKGKENDAGSVLASLQLSYDELPPELKHCVLCFSIYPEDYNINTEQLVFWWVGEGFVSGTNKRTATQVAIDYLSELFSRCLIEVENHRGYDGRIFECKMHDMVRDLIIENGKKEAFCSFNDDYVQQFNKKSRHLGLTSKIENQDPQHKSKLRTLLLMKSNSVGLSPSTGLANVKSLRVLDLSQSKLDGHFRIDDLLLWIRSQSRLAYLNLRGVAGLKQVPKWIRKLRNLQILILADCNDLELLSPDIKTLPKLTVLDIRNCPSLQNLPQGLGNLSNLEELSGFRLASGDGVGCRLHELESLSNLRVLRINIHERDDIKADELYVLSCLNLQVLSIDTNNSKNEEILKKVDQLVPPKCLEELYLRKYSRNVTPEWLTPSKLPELQYLYIEQAELTLESTAFSYNKEKHWNILGLCLKQLPRLQLEWQTVQKIMPEIEYVEVSRCYQLQKFPFDVSTCGVWRKKENHAKIKEETS